jgi:hypothetical protein
MKNIYENNTPRTLAECRFDFTADPIDRYTPRHSSNIAMWACAASVVALIVLALFGGLPS